MSQCAFCANAAEPRKDVCIYCEERIAIKIHDAGLSESEARQQTQREKQGKHEQV